MEIFQYGEKEISHLKNKDKRLGAAIDHIGHINREIDTDLFCALVSSIVGQQISSKSQATILNRMYTQLGMFSPEKLAGLESAEIQRFGMSMRKAEYIKNAAERVLSGEMNLDEFYTLSDVEVIKRLSSLKGVGVWTAEMLMLFCMQRPDILSFGDYAILRGMRMLYHKREITREQFERYRKRYSPYGSVASLYLWAISGGAFEGLAEPQIKKTQCQ